MDADTTGGVGSSFQQESTLLWSLNGSSPYVHPNNYLFPSNYQNREKLEKPIAFCWDSHNTPIRTSVLDKRYRPARPSHHLDAERVWESRQILVNCSFQSCLLDAAYLVIPIQLADTVTFVDSSFFHAQIIFNDFSICTPKIFAYNLPS